MYLKLCLQIHCFKAKSTYMYASELYCNSKRLDTFCKFSISEPIVRIYRSKHI